MALHSSDNRHLGVSPFGAVMTNGYSLDLGLDQFGVFSKAARKTTKKGLKALSTFDGIDKQREKIALLFGTKGDNGFLGSSKNSRSVDFSLNNVTRVGVSHPQNSEQKFDYWRIGWNGLDTNTSLKFFRGQTVEFQMTIKGVAATFFNSTDEYTVKVPVVVDNLEFGICDELGNICEPVDCRENTLKLVKDLNNYSLPTGQKLSDYFDIYPIFETPVAATNPIVYNRYCLEYCGFGGQHELSAVSAQYPDYEVVRDTMSNKFTVFIPAADGAPAPFVQKKGDLLKGCEACPEGYTEVPAGIVYAVALEDDGEDLTATVEALPNAVAGTAVKTGQDFGVGHYIVILSKDLTAEEEAAFVVANPTAVLFNAGTKEAFCSTDETITHEWVQCGTCSASEETYRMVVADDCNGSRYEDVVAAYPDLTITQVQNQNCLSVFETKVMTNFNCDEGCNPAIIEQVFSSEAPAPFGINNYWFPYQAATVATSGACGFEIKAKPIILNPGTCVEDDVPFIMTSSRITAISGGYPLDYSMNTMVPQNAWTVTQLERAKDLDNLGGNLKGWEQRGRFYFSNEKPYRSLIEREMTGTHSRLENMVQYSDFYVEIEKSNKAGINDKEYTYITYHVLVPFGRTGEMEAVLQKLAGAAGVPFEVK